MAGIHPQASDNSWLSDERLEKTRGNERAEQFMAATKTKTDPISAEQVRKPNRATDQPNQIE